MHHISWLEAGVIGAVQGMTELFPVSSLGHSVLIPAVIGGSWQADLNVSSPESPYLAFIVGLHVATAVALIIYFWRDWLRIVTGLITSIAHRSVRTADQRLAWLLVLATIPVGLVGLFAEHWFRTTLSKPVPTAIFIMINGLLLLGAEALRRRRPNCRHRICRRTNYRSDIGSPFGSAAGRPGHAHRVGADSRVGTGYLSVGCDDGRRHAAGPEP